MLSDITLTNQALHAAIAAGDDAEARRLEELEEVQWRKREVTLEIQYTRAHQEAARAAGDEAEVRRLEEVMRPLWVTLYELRAKDPTDPHTRAAAQGEVITALGVLTERRRAARTAGDAAELHRLLEVPRPLRSRMAKIIATDSRRRTAARTSPDKNRLFDEARAQWNELAEFWRANPFDPHTI